jgi:hypothetical protein
MFHHHHGQLGLAANNSESLTPAIETHNQVGMRSARRISVICNNLADRPIASQHLSRPLEAAVVHLAGAYFAVRLNLRREVGIGARLAARLTGRNGFVRA